MKKIGIFGGTFNPAHKGHLESLKWAKESAGLDAIWLFPTFSTPGGKISIERVSAKHRLNILKASTKDFNKKWINVSDYEIKQKGESFTHLTIEMMKNKFPEADLYLIMGDDRYGEFNRWKKYEYMREQVKVIVLKRHDVKKLSKIDERDIYISDKISPISSSDTLSTSMWSNLYPSAIKYIASHRLYLKEVAFKTLYDKRWDHTLSVATHARRLMKKNYIFGEDDAYVAGLIHDLAKYVPEHIQREQLGEGYEDIPDKALHGFTAAKWLEEEYGLKNKKILSAMRKHTLADKEMSKLDKVLYVADKIASDRKGRKFFVWRRLAYKNLDETFKKILKESTKHLETKGITPHPNTKEAYKKYVIGDYGIKENKKKYGND